MTLPTGAEPGSNNEPRTFTQDQVNALLADDRRKNAAKYADYTDLKEKAGKFDALQSDLQTDQQRWEQERDQLRASASASAAELARYKAAAAVGLPSDLIEFITATDAEQAEAQAKKLLERMGGDQPGRGQQPPSGGPQPPAGGGLDQGTRRPVTSGGMDAGRERARARFGKTQGT